MLNLGWTCLLCPPLRWTASKADDESGVCSLFRSLINPQIQLIQRRIQLAEQQTLWMWSDSSMVPSPFWIRLFVRGLKIHVLWTSYGHQCPYNDAPVATGGSMIQFWLSSRTARAVATPAWTDWQWRPVSTGCKGRPQKTAAPRGYPARFPQWSRLPPSPQRTATAESTRRQIEGGR